MQDSPAPQIAPTPQKAPQKVEEKVEAPPSSSQKSSKPEDEGTGKAFLKVFLIVGAIVLLIFVVVGLFVNNNQSQTSTDQASLSDFYDLDQVEQSSIDGRLSFSGIKPQEDGDGIVTLWQRELGSNEFRKIDTIVELRDQASWIFADANTNKTYEIKASISSGGYFIKDSNVLIVTAPAISQVLDFNVALEDIPSQLLAQARNKLNQYIAENSEVKVTVSGLVELNGYIPDGSKIIVFQRKRGENDVFQVIDNNIAAVDGASFFWSGARLGQEYGFIAKLFDSSGINIGDSEIVSRVAPSNSVLLVINSTATTPPVEKPRVAVISGFVELNGAVPDGTSVLILQRKPGEIDYKEIERLSAKNGITWSWNQVIPGQVYEIEAALQYQLENVSTSNMITVAAPASNEKLILNSGWTAPAPGSMPTASCRERKGTDQVRVKLTYPRVENATQYHIFVGSKPGYSDIFNRSFGVVSEDIVIDDFYVDAGKEFYTAYAVAYCSNCAGNSYFSGSSPSLQFKCN